MFATETVCLEFECADVQKSFLEMLPIISRVANNAFPYLRCAAREDLVAEVIANAFVAYQRLVERGKTALAYPTVLARFAIRQVRAGRRLGSRLNVHDVMSPYAQQRKQIRVQSLARWNASGHWEELVVEDKRSTPAEIASFRLDFRAWLCRLDRRRRAVVLRLAAGESTGEVARLYGVSPARISQFRSELMGSWQAFQGEHLSAAV